MYKKASELALRFPTPKGSLTVEQLWQLSQTDLATSIKNVKKILKKSDEEDLNFLDETTTPDVENQLRFDILKDVYLTKKEKAAALKTAADTKAYNERILSIIADKKEQKLLDLPIEELEKLIK